MHRIVRINRKHRWQLFRYGRNGDAIRRRKQVAVWPRRLKQIGADEHPIAAIPGCEEYWRLLVLDGFPGTMDILGRAGEIIEVEVPYKVWRDMLWRGECHHLICLGRVKSRY